MILLSLPLGLLQIVTEHLCSHELGLLLSCGNKRLTQRLGEDGGVIRVRHELRDSNPTVWPSLVTSFPKMLTFQLIRVRGSSFQGSKQILMPMWSHLPETLKNIDLDYPNDCDDFIVPRVLERFPLLESISCQEGMYYDDPDFNFSALRNACPKISSISFVGAGFFVAYMPFELRSLTLDGDITKKFDHMLPETLTSVNLRNFQEPLDSDVLDCIMEIPRLETLILQLKDHLHLEDLARLPKTVTTLKIPVSGALTAAVLQMLPPQLSTLYLDGAWIFGKDIKYIPRSVTSTNILHVILPKEIPFLPPGLQDVDKCTVSTAVASLLPKAITSALELQLTSKWSIPKSTFTPSQRLLRCPSLPSNPDTEFPTTMTALEVNETDCIEDLPNGDCIELPATLRHLTLMKSRHMKLLTDDFLTQLPEQLISLDIAAYVKDISFDLLPDTLTLFKLVCDTLPIGAVEELPASLTKLHLVMDHLEEGFSEDLLSNLPESLRMLHFETTHRTSDCKASNEDVMNLPKDISWISLPASSALTPKCIQNLPSSVAFFQSLPIKYQK